MPKGQVRGRRRHALAQREMFLHFSLGHFFEKRLTVNVSRTYDSTVEGRHTFIAFAALHVGKIAGVGHSLAPCLSSLRATCQRRIHFK